MKRRKWKIMIYYDLKKRKEKCLLFFFTIFRYFRIFHGFCGQMKSWFKQINKQETCDLPGMTLEFIYSLCGLAVILDPLLLQFSFGKNFWAGKFTFLSLFTSLSHFIDFCGLRHCHLFFNCIISLWKTSECNFSYF